MTCDPPYPRLGEALRFLSGALDTKRRNRDIDRLAREGDFDWELISGLIDELIVEPLARQIDPPFANLVGQWLAFVKDEYVRSLRTISLDALSREEALPLLERHLFSAWVANLLVITKDRFGGPDLRLLLAPNETHSPLFPEVNPIDAVFLWIEHTAGIRGGALTNLFYSIHDGDPGQRDQVERWRKGKYLPDLGSVVIVLNSWERLRIRHPNMPSHVNCLRWLLVARAICWAERRSSDLRRNITEHLDALQTGPTDVGPYFDEAIASAARPATEVIPIALQAMHALSLHGTKEVGALASADALLREMGQVFDRIEMRYAIDYWWHWCNARQSALCGKLAEAMHHYEQAADLALYRCGPEQKTLLREAIYLAAHLKKASIYKQLMHRCLALEMVPRPYSGLETPSWIPMDYYSRFFECEFPESGRFREGTDD